MIRLRQILITVRGQLWLLPAFMTLIALGLAYVMLSQRFNWTQFGDTDLWWLFSGDAATARNLLSTLLSGMMTITSLVVSMTFVILTLAANQLGPRLIWRFIEDRQIQSIIGLFLGTIFYIVIVLRTLDDQLARAAVPHLAVTVGTVLTLACLFALLFYVHKIAHSIVADNVVEHVARRLHESLNDILPDKEDAPPPPVEEELPPHAAWISIGEAGYIQTIDYNVLVDVANEYDAILRVPVRAGHFLLRTGNHVEIRSDSPINGRAVKKIRKAFVIGPERNATQDLEFSFRQLVEVALRALSPGINDPFTAIAVVDRLGEAIEAIQMRAQVPGRLRDEKGHLRVIASHSETIGLVDACFDQIRQASREKPALLIHIADTLGKLAGVLTDEGSREAALRQLDSLAQAAEGLPFPYDKDEALRRIDAARVSIVASEPDPPPKQRHPTPTDGV
ncbi:DUF2254 domain-containing protein [Microvirga roseola]|uniref:DUF2254 domain-containing protein n=1 Tax=Microvirga roseola TaxID=2883126 RepID=UPI001E64B58F|nr:DUF2254 domain-containing protein [Microvirga roseola]